jgi:hypothetical protein
MKIVIAGGSGYLGTLLAKTFDANDDVVLLSRNPKPTFGNVRTEVWDGKNLGDWHHELEGAQLLINMTGKSVDCRYNEKNKREIINSRLDSVRVLGEAISKVKYPPSCWIQSSSATIYRHAEDREMDEESGEIGEGFSVDVCKQWETTFFGQVCPLTRKVVLRTGIVLGHQDGALPVLARLARFGLGGAIGNGKQYVSWIHETDFARTVHWVYKDPKAMGVYNCTSPWPLPNALFMRNLRHSIHAKVSVNLPKILIIIGAFFLRTEPELILKSRRVVPARLQSEGFCFEFGRLSDAFNDIFR